jgi:hypothetical protein
MRTPKNSADALPTAGIDHMRLDDPSAQIITSVNGPKTSPGSKLHWVQGEDGPRVILHQHPGGRFDIYEKRKPAPKLEPLGHSAQGASVTALTPGKGAA